MNQRMRKFLLADDGGFILGFWAGCLCMFVFLLLLAGWFS